jgi:hypothetical protein
MDHRILYVHTTVNSIDDVDEAHEFEEFEPVSLPSDDEEMIIITAQGDQIPEDTPSSPLIAVHSDCTPDTPSSMTVSLNTVQSIPICRSDEQSIITNVRDETDGVEAYNGNSRDDLHRTQEGEHGCADNKRDTSTPPLSSPPSKRLKSEVPLGYIALPSVTDKEDVNDITNDGESGGNMVDRSASDRESVISIEYSDAMKAHLVDSVESIPHSLTRETYKQDDNVKDGRGSLQLEAIQLQLLDVVEKFDQLRSKCSEFSVGQQTHWKNLNGSLVHLNEKISQIIEKQHERVAISQGAGQDGLKDLILRVQSTVELIQEDWTKVGGMVEKLQRLLIDGEKENRQKDVLAILATVHDEVCGICERTNKKVDVTNQIIMEVPKRITEIHRDMVVKVKGYFEDTARILGKMSSTLGELTPYAQSSSKMGHDILRILESVLTMDEKVKALSTQLNSTPPPNTSINNAFQSIIDTIRDEIKGAITDVVSAKNKTKIAAAEAAQKELETVRRDNEKLQKELTDALIAKAASEKERLSLHQQVGFLSAELSRAQQDLDAARQEIDEWVRKDRECRTEPVELNLFL